MNLLKPYALVLLAFGAVCFFVSGQVQSEDRVFYIVYESPALAIVYECNNNRRYAIESYNLTDGIHTLRVIEGPCTEV